MPKTVIGVMGPGSSATAFDLKNAYDIGRLIAEKGYVTLTGGRPNGVMEAALKAAKDAGGQTVGILPSGDKRDASAYADIVIVTAMMSARNNINALSSDVVVACGIEAGTLSEIALALKADKNV
ncbi:MAG: cytochrome, partial [Alphaproteobacteria bacterium]